MDTKRFGDRRSAVVITKWLNLGHGDTPLDPRWRRHLYQSFEQRPKAFPIEEADGKNGIRGLFERQEGKSQETLTEEGASTLCAGLFRNTFERCLYSNIWVRQVHLSTVAGRVVTRSSRPNLKDVVVFVATLLAVAMICLFYER